jgi:DUF4097 and DUF4098 domain-containing protein YvlB
MKQSISTLILLCIISLPLSGQGREIKKDISRSFDVHRGTVLHLKHGDGNVNMNSWDKDVVEIKVHYRASYSTVGAGGKRDFDVEFSQSGNDIYVTGKETGTVSIGIHFQRQYEYEYTIQGPAYLDLDVNGEDGNLFINDWNSVIHIDGEDGDVELRNIQSDDAVIRLEDGDTSLNDFKGFLTLSAEDGDVKMNDCAFTACKIHLEDGDITGRELSGDFDLKLEDGDARLDDVSLSEFQCTTQDGDVVLGVQKADKIQCEISTDDGDVLLRLDRDISARVEINTDDGGIRFDVPGQSDYKKKKNHLSAVIGDGDGWIRVSTGDGNVTMRELR